MLGWCRFVCRGARARVSFSLRMEKLLLCECRVVDRQNKNREAFYTARRAREEARPIQVVVVRLSRPHCREEEEEEEGEEKIRQIRCRRWIHFLR